MSQIVVDTDVASYLFNWHSSAQSYVNLLRGSELILSFMSIAELRMGAFSANWGEPRRLMLERFIKGFELVYADDHLCTILGANSRRSAGGRPRIKSPGRLIAAVALALDAPLVTNNRRDYEPVRSLRLWTL